MNADTRLAGHPGAGQATSASAALKRRALRRLLTWLLAGLALAGVFSLYLRPAFMVDLANAVWACF